MRPINLSAPSAPLGTFSPGRRTASFRTRAKRFRRRANECTRREGLSERNRKQALRREAEPVREGRGRLGGGVEARTAFAGDLLERHLRVGAIFLGNRHLRGGGPVHRDQGRNGGGQLL